MMSFMSQHGTTFGRRDRATQNGAIRPRTAAPRREDFRYRSEADAAIAAHAVAEANAERFVIRFTWWLTWVAFGILFSGATSLSGLLFPQAGGLKTFGSLTPFDNQLFVVASIGMIVIGGVWFVNGLLGRQALVMTDKHVRGFTLYGTKTIRWEDVSRVTTSNHGTYGKEIQIHAARGTPSSSIFLNCIPLYVALTDSTAEEVTAAIRHFRAEI